MTIKEVSEKLGISEKSISSNLKRTQNMLLKKNIKLIKEGRGKTASYEIEYLSDNRAMTLYEEVKEDIILSQESTKFANWEFLVFLAIVTTPMLVFRGSYKDFLNYVQVPATDIAVGHLKEALQTLSDNDQIMYKVDKTNEEYFVATIYRKVEEECKIGITMVKECQRLKEKYNKQSIVPLIKVWLGVQILSERQPYTIADLVQITGLPMSTVKDNNRILKESEIYRTTRAYRDLLTCVGSNVEFNGFYTS